MISCKPKFDYLILTRIKHDLNIYPILLLCDAMDCIERVEYAERVEFACDNNKKRKNMFGYSSEKKLK